MKKFAFVLVVLLLLSAGAWADAVTLTADGTNGPSKDTYDVLNVTFGNTITFQYQFLDVTWAGSGFPFLNVNGKALVNPFPDYNDYSNVPTGLLTGTIDTSGIAGSIGTLQFTADTFGIAGNRVVILIQNVEVDGQLIAAGVPEPGTMVLLFAGLGATALRRKLHRR